jgi:hypothetical protein
MKRPGGVTILAVLALIGGILLIFSGIGVIGLRNQIVTANSPISPNAVVPLGIVVLIAGVLDILFAIGAFRGAAWAWLLGVVAEVLSLGEVAYNVYVQRNTASLTTLVTSYGLSVLISIIILVYLSTTRVRQFFFSQKG